MSEATAPEAARRVLLIEDHGDSRLTLARWFARRGFEVETAPTGEAGVAMARTFRPEWIMLDLGLPDTPGFEVAERIRAIGLETEPNIVITTGFTDPETVSRIHQAGFAGYLVKPLNIDSLRDILDSSPSKSPDDSLR